MFCSNMKVQSDSLSKKRIVKENKITGPMIAKVTSIPGNEMWISNYAASNRWFRYRRWNWSWNWSGYGNWNWNRSRRCRCWTETLFAAIAISALFIELGRGDRFILRITSIGN